MLPAYSAARHLNDRSLALLVRYGDFSVLLTGDAETAALTRLVRTGAVSDVTVLKASHHGSDNGFTDSLLAVARPEVVVISVGSGNAFGHPGALAVSAYYGAAAEVYRTDLDGTGTSARSTVSGRRRRRCLEGGLPSTSPLPYLTSQVTLHHKVIGKTTTLVPNEERKSQLQFTSSKPKFTYQSWEAVMFDLEKAIRRWRRGLEHGSSLSTRELDELEDHLRARAELESHLNPGLQPALAFATARAELGEPAAVSREFAKAGKPRWRRLLVAGWALFGVSFLLPTFFTSGPGLGLFSRPFATEPYFGYEVFWKLLSEGGELANVLAALIPNLVLVLTLPALRGKPGKRRRGLRWSLTTVGVATLALAFLAPRIEMRGNGWEPVFAELGIGFWVWSLSFVCAASALWLRDSGRARSRAAESTA